LDLFARAANALDCDEIIFAAAEIGLEGGRIAVIVQHFY
jgi:hypothetical protein